MAFLAALAWAPFWLGGNRPLPWGVDAVLFPGLVLVYEASLLLRRRPHPVGARVLAVPLVLFIGVAAWIVIQMSAFVPESWRHPIWEMAAQALERPIDGSVSVSRDLTSLALLRLLTAASALWLSIQLCANAGRAHLLISAAGVTVAAYAAFGLVSYALFSNAIFWLDPAEIKGMVRSTFVNRNSFATYAGLGLVATLGAALRLYQREAPDLAGPVAYRLSTFIELAGRRGWALLGTGFVTLAALLGTGSRGGILSAALGVAVLLVLTLARRRHRAAAGLEGAAVLIAAAIACFVFFGDIFVGRLAREGLVDVGRVSVYSITLRSIFDAPLLGFGYGAFADVFPMYRDRSIAAASYWDKAHNSYLEVFQGLGLIAGSMLLAALLFFFVKCAVGSAERRRDATAPIVASAACALVGVHALVDFSMQIQGVTLTFMALLGAGFAQSMSSRIAASD